LQLLELFLLEKFGFFFFLLPLLAIRITSLSQWSGLCTILIGHYLDVAGITYIEVSLVS
jgi:hypothetical protein